MALPQLIERQTRAVDTAALSYELSEKRYPSGGPLMPASSVHGCVAAQLASVIGRHLRTDRRISSSTGK